MKGAKQGARLCLALFKCSSALCARPRRVCSYASRTAHTSPDAPFEAHASSTSAAWYPELVALAGLQQVSAVWATKAMSSQAEKEETGPDTDGGAGLPYDRDDIRVPQASHRDQVSLQDLPTCTYPQPEPGAGPIPNSTTTADWVAHILAPGALEDMDRSRLTMEFKSITQMLSVAFHPASPRHQIPVLRRRADELKYTLDPQLPKAIAVLIAQADEHAGHRDSQRPKLHPPIALKLVADVLHAAPPPLLQSVIAKKHAADSLSSLLHMCSTSKALLCNPKYASMTFHSLVLLRHLAIFRGVVNRACHGILGRVRMAEVSKYDLPALEGLCWLVAQFRSRPDQKIPRPWWTAMRQIEGLASERTLPFFHAARIAESIADVGNPPRSAIQAALMRSAAEAAEKKSNNVTPVAISQFLKAAVRLELDIDDDLAKALCVQALHQTQRCKLNVTMSMLGSLRLLDVQLSSQEMKVANQQVLRHLEGATIFETLQFLHDARDISMQLGDRFVTAATKSIAAGLNKPDIDPETERKAYEALHQISVRSPSLTV